jgi:hypothetical protein
LMLCWLWWVSGDGGEKMVVGDNVKKSSGESL